MTDSSWPRHLDPLHLHTPLPGNERLHGCVEYGIVLRIHAKPEFANWIEGLIQNHARHLGKNIAVDLVGAILSCEERQKLPKKGEPESSVLKYFEITALALAGETLESKISRRGRLSLPEAADTLNGITTALSYLTKNGVQAPRLHPRTIFVTEQPRGIIEHTRHERGVNLLDVAFDNSQTTNQPGIIGADLRSFHAPEQFSNDNFMPTDRSYVWTLGLIAFFMLTGRVFWRGTTAEALRTEITKGKIPTASDRATELGFHECPFPEPFSTWFARCVTRDNRYATPSEALRVFSTLLGTPPGPPVRDEDFLRSEKPFRVEDLGRDETSVGTSVPQPKCQSPPIAEVRGSQPNQPTNKPPILFSMPVGSPRTVKSSRQFEGHQGIVSGARFAEDGVKAYSSSMDGFVAEWDLTHGSRCDLQAATSARIGLLLAPQHMLISYGADSLELWDRNSRTLLCSTQWGGKEIAGIAIRDTGSLVAAVSSDGLIRVWETQEWRVKREISASKERSIGFNAILFDQNADSGYVGGNDGWIHRWNIHSEYTTPIGGVPTCVGGVYCLAKHGDNIVVAGQDGAVKLVDPLSGGLIKSHSSHLSPIFCIAGQKHLIATGDADGKIVVWNPERDQVLFELTGFNSRVSAIDISPSGDRVIASCFLDKKIHLWQPEPVNKVRQQKIKTKGPKED